MTNRPTDILIALNTLGRTYNSAVIAIGCAAFNRRTGVIGPKLYVSIAVADAMRYGRTSAEGMDWWSKQCEKSKVNPLAEREGDVTLFEGLRALSDFVRAQPAGVKPWGNANTATEIAILEHAYDSNAKLSKPQWEWWDTRDLRTLIDVIGFDPASVKFDGERQHALHEAEHQAKIAVACFKQLQYMEEQSL